MRRGDLRVMSRAGALRRLEHGTGFSVRGRAPHMALSFLVSRQTFGCQQFWGGVCDEGGEMTLLSSSWYQELF